MADNQKREFDELKGLKELIWSWSHGLNRQIAILRFEIELIRQKLKDSALDVSYIHSRLDKMERMVKEIAETPSPFDVELVSLNSLIEERVEQLRQRVPYAMVTFTVDLTSSEVTVIANPIWLRRILDILIDNGVEAMKENVKKQVKITSSVNEQRVSVSVSDTGRGINRNLLARLFQMPAKLDPDGKGRGLYIARLLIDVYDGDIYVHNTGPEGTNIVVQLPLA